jgi:hypothetical protein
MTGSKPKPSCKLNSRASLGSASRRKLRAARCEMRLSCPGGPRIARCSVVPTKPISSMKSIVTRSVNMSEYALKVHVLMVTLNQRVPGSSPGAPTISTLNTATYDDRPSCRLAVGHLGHTGVTDRQETHGIASGHTTCRREFHVRGDHSFACNACGCQLKSSLQSASATEIPTIVLIEQRFPKPKVGGSTPLGTANFLCFFNR